MTVKDRRSQSVRYLLRRFLCATVPACVIAWLVASCQVSRDVHGGRDSAIERSPAAFEDSAIVRLDLQPGRVLTLGDATSSPSSVNASAASEFGLALLDYAARVVRVYEWSGRERYHVQYGPMAEDAPSHANAIALAGDTLLIADSDPSRGVWLFARDGRMIRRVSLATAWPVTSIARIRGGFAIGTTALDEAITADTAQMVVVFDDSGKQLGAGCKPSLVYGESIRRRGMFAIFRATDVAVVDNDVYCKQAVESRVQQLDVAGRAVGETVSTPSFYRRPPDVRGSMDLASIHDFRKRFTEHHRLFATETSLVSVFASFDSVAQHDRYFVWQCDRSDFSRCRGYASSLRPLGKRGADSIALLMRQRSPQAPLEIAIRFVPNKVP